MDVVTSAETLKSFLCMAYDPGYNKNLHHHEHKNAYTYNINNNKYEHCSHMQITLKNFVMFMVSNLAFKS
jgi:hypothetical protein